MKRIVSKLQMWNLKLKAYESLIKIGILSIIAGSLIVGVMYADADKSVKSFQEQDHIDKDMTKLLTENVLLQKLADKLEEENSKLVDKVTTLQNEKDNITAELKNVNELSILNDLLLKELEEKLHTRYKKILTRRVNPLPSRYLDKIQYEVEKYNFVNPGHVTKLVIAMIDIESNFRPNVVNRIGATGLGQILPSTGLDIHTRIMKNPASTFNEESLKDPDVNIEYMVAYVSERLKAFGYNRDLFIQRYCGASTRERATFYIDKVDNFLLDQFGLSLDGLVIEHK